MTISSLFIFRALGSFESIHYKLTSSENSTEW